LAVGTYGRTEAEVGAAADAGEGAESFAKFTGERGAEAGAEFEAFDGAAKIPVARVRVECAVELDLVEVVAGKRAVDTEDRAGRGLFWLDADFDVAEHEAAGGRFGELRWIEDFECGIVDGGERG
jgi:hypothetical protein